MKKVLQIVFIALILAMGLVLSAGVIICGPSEPGANEKLSGTPALHNKDGSWNDHFLKDTATWFSDHFFLRQELISLNNRISAVLFNTSGEESVIIGKEGWLYFESTLDDYTGRNPMTDKELSAAAHNLELMAQFCREQGKDFVFIIAPNKNSLYPQFMPDFGVVAHERDAQKLLSRLENTPVIDLFSAFDNESEILYFRTDSHWNSKGAALAADLINQKFGKETAYFTAPYSYRNDYTGDLFTMIYPVFSGDETQPYYGGKLDFRYTGKATKPDSITLLTESDKDGSLLVYRDSFGNLLYPYLADSYGSVRFSRSTSYDLTPEADHVVVELVERNLDYLISYLPVMPSPLPCRRRSQVQLVSPSTREPPHRMDTTNGPASAITRQEIRFMSSPKTVLTMPSRPKTALAFIYPKARFPQMWLSYTKQIKPDIKLHNRKETTMKRIIPLLLCLMLLCGCGGNTNPKESTPATTTPATQVATGIATVKPADDAFELAESCIGKSVDELIALIGEPESSDYAPSCLIEGAEDGNWYYDGFTVYTLRTADGETVEYVE